MPATTTCAAKPDKSSSPHCAPFNAAPVQSSLRLGPCVIACCGPDPSWPIPFRSFEEGASRHVDAHRNIVRAGDVGIVNSDDGSISGYDRLHTGASTQPEDLGGLVAFTSSHASLRC